MDYQIEYVEFHEELLAFVSARFSHVESGLQCDSHISIFVDDEKVAIDTFTSMKHQIKSQKSGQHVQKVIEALQLKYKLKVYGRT